MNKYLDDLDQVLRSCSDDSAMRLSDSAMRLSDRYVGEYLCLARIKVTNEVFNLLLED